MSRGRKAKTISNGSTWEQIFQKSQGFYFQYIISNLAIKGIQLSTANANNLLEKIKQEKEKLISEKKIKKDNPLPLVESDKILFKIPSNWIWCRLNDVFDVRDGTHDTPKYHQSGFPLVTSKNLYTGELNLSNVQYISEIDYKKICERSKVDRYDILFAMIGSIGNPVIVNTDEPFAIKNVALFKYYDKQLSEPKFLNFYLQLVAEQMRKEASGSLQPFVSLKFLRSFQFPLPPLNEQKMIVNFLGDFGNNSLDENIKYFDSEIENEVISIHQAQIYNNQISTELNHQLALVKELRQAYLREAMQGKLVPQDERDEPAEILLEKIKAEKEKLVAEKRIKRDKPLPPINAEEIPFEIPSNWTWCRLEEIFTFINGDRSSKYPSGTDIKNSGIPFINSKNLIDNVVNLDPNQLQFITTEKFNTLSGGKLADNDILMVLRGSVGKVGIFYTNENYNTGFINAQIVILRRNLELNADYLIKVLQSVEIQSSIIDRSTGSAQPQISAANLKKAVIPLSPLAEQERIVAKLEKLMKFCDELEANIRQGITRADKLLQTALKEALEPK